MNMLISKGYDAGDIVSFKLSNGDEIVARVKEEKPDAFVVTKPCTVLPSPKGMGLIQSLFTATGEGEIPISKHHVIMHSATVKDVKDYYVEVTTGIKPVSSSIVV